MKLTKEDVDRWEQCCNEVGPYELIHISPVRMVALLRLARLGLWAEQHGIPLAKAARDYQKQYEVADMGCAAIAALPKGDE